MFREIIGVDCEKRKNATVQNSLMSNQEIHILPTHQEMISGRNAINAHA